MRLLYTVHIAVHDVESAGIWLRKDRAYERNRKGGDREEWRLFGAFDTKDTNVFGIEI
jgi:hypothetical protein